MAAHQQQDCASSKTAVVHSGCRYDDLTNGLPDQENKEAGSDVESGTVLDSQASSVPEGGAKNSRGGRFCHKCTIAMGAVAGVAALCVAAFFIIYNYNIKHLQPPGIDVINCEGAAWTHNGLNINVTVLIQATSHVSHPCVMNLVKVDVYYPDKETGIYVGTVGLKDIWVPALAVVTEEGTMTLRDVVNYPRGLGSQLITERLGTNTTTHLELYVMARAHMRLSSFISIPYKMRAVCSFGNTWSTRQRHTRCHAELLPWWAKIGI